MLSPPFVLITGFLTKFDVNGFGCGFTGTHCEDNGSGAGYSVAAGIHAGFGGQSIFIDHDSTPAVKLKILSGVFDQRVGVGAQ